MADREVKPMRELLANIDKDMERNFKPPTARQQRSPDEQQRVADLTGDVLRKAAEDTSTAVIKAVDEVETMTAAIQRDTEIQMEETHARVAKLRQQAGEAVVQLKTWTDDYARRNTELVQRCHALESMISETVNDILKIGRTGEGT
jgi:hypothetical protein